MATCTVKFFFSIDICSNKNFILLSTNIERALCLYNIILITEKKPTGEKEKRNNYNTITRAPMLVIYEKQIQRIHCRFAKEVLKDEGND
jgi:hypothetical protein